MSDFLYILLVVFGIIGVSFFLLNIRHIFTGQEFRGTCASNNPALKNEVGECSMCGSKTGEECKSEEAVA
jgi:hypothetical protein